MLSPLICKQARLSRDPRFDGLFFILVKTTKIFCRNICKVRMPLEKNVTYAASAQIALAQGYRPCLRCRPDSAPHSHAWQGVHTTVRRAMDLLSEQKEQSIAHIALRLGISSRYMNKLFNTHLQVPPKRFRVYQQVLMAKNLLQQTNVSVEQVAHTVGFASARQLQQHVKTHLQLTPTQIRNNQDTQHSTPSKPLLNSEISLLLSYRPPYNWPQVRDFFARRAIHGNETISQNGFEKVLSIHGQGVLVSVQHCPQKNAFVLRFNASFVTHTLVIISVINRILDLQASPQIIQDALMQAGLLAPELVSGLRVPGVACAFEAGCRAILGQQVSVTAAVNKVNELHQHFAQSEQSKFPEPAEVAASDLLFLKMPAQRRQSLIDLAQYFANAKLASNEPVNTQLLLPIKGIGPWTVNYIEMRAQGNSDVWLNGDLIIKQQTAKFAAINRVLKPDLAAPWRSYLTLNLWSLAK